MKNGFDNDTIRILYQMFGQLPFSVVITDEDGRIILLNDHYAHFLGVDKERAIGNLADEIIPNSRLSVVLATGQPEISQQHFYGKGVKSVVHRIPLFNKGKISGCLGIVIFDSMDELQRLATAYQELHSKLSKYKNEINSIYKAKYSLNQIIGNSKIIKERKKLARRLAKSDANILITGESGTGKELWAHAIHTESLRSDGPFVAINCGAIPETLLESELFGYEEGAFTGAKKGGKLGKFQLAHGGTLFLDEIGDMPLIMQVKILRVLQEHELERIGGNEAEKVDVRIIAATNKNLEQMVKKGSFREDLFFRLNILSLELPPLRERPEDIPLLVKHFVSEYCNHTGMIKQVEPEAVKVLGAYSWPGNIRELAAVIQRLLVSTDAETVRMSDLPPNLYFSASIQNKFRTSTFDKVLQEVECELIRRALELANYSKSGAAKILEIPRTRLYRKLEQYGIEGRDGSVAKQYTVTKENRD